MEKREKEKNQNKNLKKKKKKKATYHVQEILNKTDSRLLMKNH